MRSSAVCRLTVLLALSGWPAVIAGQETTFQRIWYIDGPVVSLIAPDDPRNEMRLAENQIELVLYDGQTLTIHVNAVTRIRYFRQFQREDIVNGGGGLVPLALPGEGLFHRRTNHYVDLVFTESHQRERVLTVRLDKSIYRAAIQRLQQITSRTVLASAEDARALSGVRTEAVDGTRALSYRRAWWPLTSAMKLAVDPDGRMLAALLRDGSVNVWNLETGVTRHRWKAIESEDKVRSFGWLAFRPRSNLLATSSPRAGVQQWHIASGASYGDAMWPHETQSVPPLKELRFWFEPEGQRLMMESDLSCWMAENGGRANCVEPHPRTETTIIDEYWTSAVGFDEAGGRALVGTYQSIRRPQFVVSLIDWRNGTPLRTATVTDGARGRDLLGFVSPDQLIGADTSPRRLRSWRVTGARLAPLWKSNVPSGITEFALSPRFIAAAGRTRDILIYSTERGRLAARLPTSSWVSALTFLPDGTLAAATAQSTIEIWDPAVSRMIRTLSVTHP